MIMRKHYSLCMCVCVAQSRKHFTMRAGRANLLSLSLLLFVCLSLLRLCAQHVLRQAHYKLTYVYMCVCMCGCASVYGRTCLNCEWEIDGHSIKVLPELRLELCFLSLSRSPLSVPFPFLLLLLLSVLMCVPWERVRSAMCFSRLAL